MERKYWKALGESGPNWNHYYGKRFELKKFFYCKYKALYSTLKHTCKHTGTFVHCNKYTFFRSNKNKIHNFSFLSSPFTNFDEKFNVLRRHFSLHCKR